MTEIRKIRREVMTIANRINKRINNLSISLKRAWRTVKAKKLILSVSGVTFGSRQTALQRIEKYIREGAEVKTTLEREQDNKFDSSAIKIMVSVNGSSAYHLGYIPRDAAELLAHVIDKVGELTAHIISIVGGYSQRETRGARLAVWL